MLNYRVLGAGRLAALGGFALIANAVLTGWLGLDFGAHWDEWNLADGLATAVRDVSLLPRNYTYGGVYFAIGFLLLAPACLPFLPSILSEIAADPTRPLAVEHYPAIVALQEALTARIGEPAFLLQSRAAFLLLSSLATLWVFATMRKLYGRDPWGALAAAAFMAASWEVAYHGRFVSPDAVMMQFAALTFALIAGALAQRDHGRIIGWLLAAAIAAGVTFGCKLPGAFMVVPVATAALVHPDLRGLRGRLVVAVVLLFALTYFVTTPGSVLDPIRYFGTIAWEGRSYQSPPEESGFLGGRLGRCWLVLVWLFGVVPSPVVALAIPMSLVTLVGFAALWRSHPAFFWCAAAFVLAYAGFMSTYRFLFVRNWLIFVPLVAIGFGAGIVACHELARRSRLAWLVPAALAAVLAYNVGWLWTAAWSIRHPDAAGAAFAARLVETMAGEPQRRFWLSPAVVARYASDPAGPISCAPAGDGSISDRDAVVFLAGEDSGFVWVFNHPWFYERIIGSPEINYAYYPVWIGRNRDRRIIVLPAGRALKRNLHPAGYVNCRARS